MKINLEYPYNNNWKYGYIVTNKENRKTVILFNSKNERSSTSYARYIVATSLGRYLNEDEHVDHKDNNKTNDELCNLQILTLDENSKKEAKRKGRLMVEMLCPCCNNTFIRRSGNSCLVESKKNTIFTCGKECNKKFFSKQITQNEREIILSKQFIRKFRLHE